MVFQNAAEKLRLAVNGKAKMSDTAFCKLLFQNINYVQLLDNRPDFFVHIVKKVKIKIICPAFFQLILENIIYILLSIAQPCRHFVGQIEAFTRVSLSQSGTTEVFSLAGMVLVRRIKIGNSVGKGIIHHFLSRFIIDGAVLVHRQTHCSETEA